MERFDNGCQTQASAAPLFGADNNLAKFVALLPNQVSTSSSSALARAGLADNTVFTRVDGSPVGPLTGLPLTFLHQHANGSFLAAGSDPGHKVWTGGPPNQPTTVIKSCSDWQLPTSTGVVGDPHAASGNSFVDPTVTANAASCSSLLRFYCVETAVD